MNKKILIDASYPDNTQVAVMDNNRLVDLESSTNSKKMIKGNIYLAKVTRVEPSLQAAFIDYGGDKNGFIPFAEIHSDYYNVPSKYREDSDGEEESDVSSSVEEESTGKEVVASDDALNGDDLDAVIDEAISDNDPGIDHVSGEEDIENIKKRNVEKYKIQEVLKRNQILLVQAAKEERGNKGAAFTTYISLAGRCCVIMPNSGSKGGVSKKIEDGEERKRLKVVVDEISSTNPVGVIIRTVGQGRSKERIENDYNYLVKLWNYIREKTLVSNAPAFIHSEENIFKRVIRDLYDNSVEGIWVEGRMLIKK
ncbi:MAG: ribonuclease E/G [Alphaproteobacteria bacterium]|nr:ribonuclease E/G [Alphaproteobacteria bacterium]